MFARLFTSFKYVKSTICVNRVKFKEKLCRKHKNLYHPGRSYFNLFQNLSSSSQYFSSIDTAVQDSNARRACGHVDVGTCPHQVLSATLTLSQPRGGGQIMPSLYWCPHQVLKATGAPALGTVFIEFSTTYLFVFFFQKDNITIRFWFLHRHQMTYLFII